MIGCHERDGAALQVLGPDLVCRLQDVDRVAQLDVLGQLPFAEVDQTFDVVLVADGQQAVKIVNIVL